MSSGRDNNSFALKGLETYPVREIPAEYEPLPNRLCAMRFDSDPYLAMARKR